MAAQLTAGSAWQFVWATLLHFVIEHKAVLAFCDGKEAKSPTFLRHKRKERIMDLKYLYTLKSI